MRYFTIINNYLKNKLTGLVCFLVILLFVYALASSTAYAHKVYIFASVKGDMVYTKSKFSSGKEVKNGRIEVYNKNGKKLLEGRTNNKGDFFLM